MSVSEDLIDFDIIETQKENIQPLSSGRSAKALVSTFGAIASHNAPTPNDTRNLNDSIREEYELELASIQDSDDPLDIYDRYIKWTLSAYPSAQATPESQLRPLLERATKSFQNVPHYKNDPRYLKMWLHYIRFFSEAPRETFAYLSRHGIGESLASFYEEFATWLEGVGRWIQAGEVFRLGVAREARPVERLLRKSNEFHVRFETRVVNAEEPSSPVLPTMRPALAAKVDPFAPSHPEAPNSQLPTHSSTGTVASNVYGRQKLRIFSDDESSIPEAGTGLQKNGSRGWENIGSAAERRKENVVAPRPWKGETLRSTKRAVGATKLSVFKDESQHREAVLTCAHPKALIDRQQVVNPKNGRTERVSALLHAVYPSENEPQIEVSFEELRAQARGWLQTDWKASPNAKLTPKVGARPCDNVVDREHSDLSPPRSPLHKEISDIDQPARESDIETTIAIDIDGNGKMVRPKRVKVKEVKGQTQTVKTNLESPTGPRLKRRQAVEPTMTLHTKAATEDILDIFNQPLRSCDPMAGLAESECDTDFDDDDYTSAGESTGTGRISGTSDFGDTEPGLEALAKHTDSAPESVSPWSDFTASKLATIYDKLSTEDQDMDKRCEGTTTSDSTEQHEQDEGTDTNELDERASSALPPVKALASNFAIFEPEDYEPPIWNQRDTINTGQNRLPFMTPIIEKTETSLSAFSAHREGTTCDVQTPSRRCYGSNIILNTRNDSFSSPLQEVVNETFPANSEGLESLRSVGVKTPNGPIIRDTQCNPVEDSVRQTIIQNAQPALVDLAGFHDYGKQQCDKAHEMRKFIKSLSKAKNSDKTTNFISAPPRLGFPGLPGILFNIKRELGQGAFAPVYLAEQIACVGAECADNLVAIKSEHPPTAWEFYVMNSIHRRLRNDARAATSILRPISFHLFADEGYLVEEYCGQGTLLDLVNLAKSDPMSGQNTLEESVAMFFTIELLRTISSIHSAGFLHGDLKADNCLVRLQSLELSEDEWDMQYHADGSHGWSSKGMTLIDFGRSIDMTAFRTDVQFIADWKAGQQDCIEMRELRPWTYQIDYFGIAGVVHSLLFGKYIEDTAIEVKGERQQGLVLGQRKQYRVKENLKRYWQTKLWTRLFDLTMNPTSHVHLEASNSMPCLNSLNQIRHDMEQWLENEGCRKSGGLKNSLLRLESRIKERKAR